MKKLILVLIVIFLLGCTNTNPNNCYNCSSREESYTVSEPTEIIYRNTTYRTVYEPKTYREVSYERRPYKNRCRTKNYCN